MAEEKKKEEKAKDPKGAVNAFNKITVTQKDYYYDREKTDAPAQKAFGDMLADLKQVNMKLQKEIEGEKPIKLDIAKGTAQPEKK